MPTSPPHPCNQPGCGKLTHERYCTAHKKAKQKLQDMERGTAHQRGYDARWRKKRANYLRKHPLCVRCQAAEKIVAATVVDHIIPHKGNKNLFNDEDNFQSLCKPCHDHKTATEDGGFGSL